jgi:predicted ATPase/DNA-binding SARP family transcriptional activator
MAPAIKPQPVTGIARLQLFGPPSWLDADGNVEPLPAGRGTELQVVLACEGGWVARTRLALLFWPDHRGPEARRNLRKVLHRLQPPKASPRWQERQGALHWPVRSDLQDFEAALAAGDIERATACRRAPLAQGLELRSTAGFADWLLQQRERLSRRWRHLLIERARAATDPAQALAAARRWLDEDPLDEEAVLLAADALQRSGQPGLARQQLQSLQADLAARLGVQASLELRRRSAGAAPAAGDAFIGRQAELRLLGQRLVPGEAGWVTLTGIGGVGKTRLADQLATRLDTDYCGAVHRISLSGPADGEQAALHLATTLASGISGDPWQHIAAACGDGPLLLVIDNVDHHADFAARLRATVSELPVQVLATSRRRLGLQGEQVWPLDGLPWPDADDLPRAQEFDAVRLFCAAAQAAWPEFDPTRETAALVALCAAVQGHPLALRLAAAWARHLSLAELTARLQRDGELPAAPGTATGASLNALWLQSWAALNAAQQQALARLSLFVGGCTPHAAVAVCDTPLPVVASLVDLSLLEAERRQGATRYRLHPMIERFASVQQLRRNDAADAERAWLDHFGWLLGQMPPPERSAERPAWYTAVDADAANVQRAWQRAVERGRSDLLALGSVGYASWCHRRADWNGGLAGLLAAEAPLASDPQARARLQCAIALLAVNAGAHRLAADRARLALRVLRRGPDRRLLRTTLFYLGSALTQLESWTAARHCLGQMLASADADDDTTSAVHALQGLAQVDADAGRPSDALALMQQVVERLQGQPLPPFMQAEQGRLLCDAGRPEQAHRLLVDALAECPPGGPGMHRSLLLGRLAQAALALGRLDDASQHLVQAQTANVSGGLPTWDTTLALIECQLARCRGEAARAQAALQRAQHQLRRTPVSALQREADRLAVAIDGTPMERRPA